VNVSFFKVLIVLGVAADSKNGSPEETETAAECKSKKSEFYLSLYVFSAVCGALFVLVLILIILLIREKCKFSNNLHQSEKGNLETVCLREDQIYHEILEKPTPLNQITVENDMYGTIL